ncbi:TMV resistance protein N-like [Neltuma alba]|uniref:TMV resistance protein N-like n=1 Tax=Neltuma alba TaxID=207710 RepID=UPI0010A2F639|nr:TMV resistance protein N-like [Prosopis alba]
MSSLASSSSKPKLTTHYDVFAISQVTTHRLPDFRFLVGSLRDDAIKLFADCINPSTMATSLSSALEAMERSTILMVIFTPEFLSTSDKLFIERLQKVMEYHKSANRPVVPVFWGAKRKQVVEHLATQYKDLDWIGIAVEAASQSGVTLSTDLRQEMGKLKGELDKYLFCNLPPHPVGLLRRVKDVLRLLMGGTYSIGVWGVAGIGKSTFARAIYDRMGGRFERKSFLANINDEWKKDNSLVHLRQQLISDVFETELDMVHGVKIGTHQMKKALCYRSAVVVFDDVNHIDQVIALCGSSDLCFGERSLVLVTSMNKNLLFGLRLYLYEMKTLDESESLELFSWHAFKEFSPKNDFMSLSRRGICFCKGLPLALEVIGSLLYNRTKKEWNNVLKKLRGIPHDQIQEKLKISFNFLTDSEKELFFNIASFYVGLNKDDVSQLLKGSRFPVEKAMHEIIQRGLVKVDGSDRLLVHHLLREIGREISHKKIKHEYTYEVFLSFRGEDTRKSFATHLYTALKKAGIEVFIDEEGIGRGEAISSSLLQAIESSRMSIIIFSKNYAGSSWCLQELEKIMECRKTTHQEVLPIFYDVQPSDVRKQRNTFGEAWKRLTLRNSTSKVKKSMISWKRALIEAANISGWDMHEWRTETELIDNVVDTITMKLDNKDDLFVAHHPVGVEPRVQDIIKLLINKSNEVIIVGIWGMGGIGKTTIAKAIFNEIGQTFEGKSFLSNVREVWKQDNGQIYLQNQILSSIFNARRVQLTSIEMGTILIKKMLYKKRVLLVLDDVNDEDQLKALCGSHEWFGQGSRVIITTRDERLLKILGVGEHKIYNMKEMNDNESLELFSWHAFKQPFPERDFVEFSRRIVSYSGGLPLALEVLGSYLFDREASIWRSDKSYATQILNGCGLHADIGIIRLVERSLVKVGKRNKLDMHDLLCNMGRHIIREKSPKDPKKWSRLWFHDDVLDVLTNCSGTDAITGLALNMSTNNSMALSAKAFENIKNLHLLQLDHVKLDGDFGYLSKELRWLCWRGFPSENLPTNLRLEKIVAIDLKWSNLTTVWEKSQMLEWLKLLNLSHCHYLTKTPDFSKLPYLEELGWSDQGFDYSQLPQDNYSDWLCFESEGSSASFKMPRVVGRSLRGMIIYIIYSSSQDSMVASAYPVGFMIKNFTKGTMDFYKRDDATTSADDNWHKIILILEPDNEIEIMVNFAQKHIVKKTLIYLVYDEGTTIGITP